MGEILRFYKPRTFWNKTQGRVVTSEAWKWKEMWQREEMRTARRVETCFSPYIPICRFDFYKHVLLMLQIKIKSDVCVCKTHSSTTHKNIYLDHLLLKNLEPFALTIQQSKAGLFLSFTCCLVFLSFPNTLNTIKARCRYVYKPFPALYTLLNGV